MTSLHISVVTVCYNAVAGIERTIQSIINQTYSNIEYIVIDGGSTDGTLDIIEKYRDRIDYFVSEPDNGIYDAMNKGIKVATGEWINFMNAGDIFFSNDVIMKVVDNIMQDASIVFGDSIMTFEKFSFVVHANPFYMKLPLHHSMGFTHQATFVLTQLAKRFKFDTSFKLAADYNMIISLYRSGYRFQQLNYPIAVFDMCGVSNQNIRLHSYETLMVDNPENRKWNIIKSYYIYFNKKMHSFIKYVFFSIFPNLGKTVMERLIHK